MREAVQCKPESVWVLELALCVCSLVFSPLLRDFAGVTEASVSVSFSAERLESQQFMVWERMSDYSKALPVSPGV